MIWTAYHSTEISNRQTEIFSQKHIFYTFVGGTFSLDISIYFLLYRHGQFCFEQAIVYCSKIAADNIPFSNRSSLVAEQKPLSQAENHRTTIKAGFSNNPECTTTIKVALDELKCYAYKHVCLTCKMFSKPVINFKSDHSDTSSST